ncbi:hypothetical protein HQQ80_13810 [Microbacteriaceae bacterium VKM Ac-2855]|nr:hypothetical protein [Microbacteriaceae bacterium VKM Ac-2855]
MRRAVGWSIVAAVTAVVVGGAILLTGWDQRQAGPAVAGFLADPDPLAEATVVSGSALGTSLWQQSQTVLALPTGAADALTTADPLFAVCDGASSCADGWGPAEAIETTTSFPLTAVPLLESLGEDPLSWSCTGRTVAEAGKSPWAEADIVCLDTAGTRLLFGRSRT